MKLSAEELEAELNRRKPVKPPPFQAIQLCDLCGNPMVGSRYRVYDENFSVQPGLFHCGCEFKK